MARPLWLVRPRNDGGCDYVNFVPGSTPGSASVEMREGSHLPPQMPLLKRRCWLQRDEAEQQRRRLQLEGGYRHSDPLF
jgi:hypothetical protein